MARDKASSHLGRLAEGICTGPFCEDAQVLVAKSKPQSQEKDLEEAHDLDVSTCGEGLLKIMLTSNLPRTSRSYQSITIYKDPRLIARSAGLMPPEVEAVPSPLRSLFLPEAGAVQASVGNQATLQNQGRKMWNSNQ